MTATVTRPKKTTGLNSASSRQPAQRDIVYDKGESELDRFFQDFIKQFTDWRLK